MKPKGRNSKPPVKNSANSTIIEKVIKLEKSAWKVAQERDANAFQELVPADAVMIFQSGIMRQADYRQSRYGGGRTMTASRKLLICGGVILAAFGTLYGVEYARFTERQTLDQLGGSLAQSFAAAAGHDSVRSQAALHEYGETKCDYVREVNAHSHWIGLALLMIVLGIIFERVYFSEGSPGNCRRPARRRVVPAYTPAAGVSSWCTRFESAGRSWSGVIVGLTPTAWGFSRRSRRPICPAKRFVSGHRFSDAAR